MSSIEGRRLPLPNRSILLVVGIAVAAVGWILSGVVAGDAEPEMAAPEAAGEPQAAAPLPKVQVIDSRAEPHPVILVLQGRTEADRTVVLRAETAGRVTGLPAAEGAAVDAEALLVKLSDDDRAARRAEASAAVRRGEIETSAAAKLKAKGFQSTLKLAEARAALAAARAGLAAADLDIARASIRAPFAGVLEDLAVEIGDFVERGDPVATVVDLDPAVVVGQITERDVSGLTVGDRAEVRFVDGSRRSGTIRFVAAAAADATRTFRIEIAADPGVRVPAGITAQIRLARTPEPAHAVSPAALTLSDAGVLGVKTVDDADRIVFRPVTVLDDGTDRVWLGGLPAAVRIVTVGQDFVAAGIRVEPVSAPPDAAAPRSAVPGVPVSRTPDAAEVPAGDAS